MPGFSITILLLPSANGSSPSVETIISLLDEDSDAPGWKWASKSLPGEVAASSTRPANIQVAEQNKRPSRLEFPDPKHFTDAIQNACKNIIAAEPEITRMDSIAGDGDCGLTLKAGASGRQWLIWPLDAFN